MPRESREFNPHLDQILFLWLVKYIKNGNPKKPPKVNGSQILPLILNLDFCLIRSLSPTRHIDLPSESSRPPWAL